MGPRSRPTSQGRHPLDERCRRHHERDPLRDLLDAVRAACLPGLWSQGMKLAREGAVIGPEGTGTELDFRVEVPGRVPPTVTLYPGDLEWSCDCGSKVDPCAHVAAAAIAAGQEGGGAAKAAPAEKPRGRVRYR